MTAQYPSNTREFWLLNLHKTDDDAALTTKDVSLILSRSVKQLESDRAAKKPPPFYYPNGGNSGPVRYKASTVKKHLASVQEVNTREEVAGPTELKLKGYNTFSKFINHAGINDQWPFTIIAGKPIDFFSAIEMERDDDCDSRWMTLGEYLRERSAWAETEPRLAQVSKLTAGTKADQPRTPGTGKGPL